MLPGSVDELKSDRPAERRRAGTGIIPTGYNTNKELEISREAFNQKKRHVLVMTEAGKPVYSRYGEESELSPLFATMSVIINKLRNIKGDGTRLTLHRMENNHTKTVIFTQDNLYVIIITKRKTDPDFLLHQLARNLIHQVISILVKIICSITNGFIERLVTNPNSSPAQNLDSHYATLSWTISACLHSYSNLFMSFMPFPINITNRKKIKETLALFKSEHVM